MLFRKVSANNYTEQNIVTKKPFSFTKATVSIRKDIFAWVLIAPSLIFFIVFIWQPLIVGIQTSFFKTQGFDLVQFVGLRNYHDVMTDSLFTTAIKNTVSYAIWSLIIGVALPIFTAIFLNEMTFLKGFFRVAVYFPCLVPGIVTAVMWKIMFDPSNAGLFNTILLNLGRQPFQWLQNPAFTIPLIIVTMTWSGFGSTTILYLADLQSVNLDLYEAAGLDGAGFFKKMIHITLPHMSALIRMLLIMQLIGVFQVFHQPWAMTGGGPNNASMSLIYVAYNYAFSYFQTGRSTAVSVITGLILAVFTIIYLKFARTSETE